MPDDKMLKGKFATKVLFYVFSADKFMVKFISPRKKFVEQRKNQGILGIDEGDNMWHDFRVSIAGMKI